LAIVLVCSALTAAIVWALKPVPSAPLRKLEISADLTAGLIPEETSSFEPAVRMSPDGARVAYMARGHLWVRDFNQVSPRDLGQLPDGSFTLTWSPDAAFLGFAAGDKKYRKIAIAGGPPVVVCDLPATGRITGAAWPTDDTIVLAAWRESLYKVSARGGVPELWLKVDAAKEIDFHNPEPLPDGRVMFRTHTRGTGADEVSLLEMFDGHHAVGAAARERHRQRRLRAVRSPAFRPPKRGREPVGGTVRLHAAGHVEGVHRRRPRTQRGGGARRHTPDWQPWREHGGDAARARRSCGTA
jgi:hypothetical protein